MFICLKDSFDGFILSGGGGGAGRQKAFNMGVVLLEGALRFKTVLVYIRKRG